MTRSTSKVPRTLAVIGIVIGFGLMMIWWYADRYDPFHLPTWQQAQGMGNFSPPLLLTVLEDLTFVLCPGSFLHMFTMDWGNSMTYLTWMVAALLNGPLYYVIGLVIVAVMKRGHGTSLVAGSR